MNDTLFEQALRGSGWQYGLGPIASAYREIDPIVRFLSCGNNRGLSVQGSESIRMLAALMDPSGGRH